jgi:hypothetical protein
MTKPPRDPETGITCEALTQAAVIWLAAAKLHASNEQASKLRRIPAIPDPTRTTNDDYRGVRDAVKEVMGDDWNLQPPWSTRLLLVLAAGLPKEAK